MGTRVDDSHTNVTRWVWLWDTLLLDYGLAIYTEWNDIIGITNMHGS